MGGVILKLLLLFILLSVNAYAVPADYISQEGSLWLLHTFTESDTGFIENVFEISAMKLRCVAQFYTDDNEIEFKSGDFSRIVSHQYISPMMTTPIPMVASRRESDTLPPLAPLTESNVARLGSLHRRAPFRSSMMAAQGSTPPSTRISPAQSPPESRRGSFPASAAATTNVPEGSNNSSRRSTITIQSVATSDGLPDFR